MNNSLRINPDLLDPKNLTQQPLAGEDREQEPTDNLGRAIDKINNNTSNLTTEKPKTMSIIKINIEIPMPGAAKVLKKIKEFINELI